MFSPEREPHPSVSEIKYLQQPVAVSLPEAATSAVITIPQRPKNPLIALLDPPTGPFFIVLKVTNRYAFRDLTHLQWKWRLVIECYPDLELQGFASLVDGKLTIDYLSMSELAQLGPPKVLGDTYIQIDGFLDSHHSWANAGHVVVSEQFPVLFRFAGDTLPAKVASIVSQGKTPLKVEQDQQHVHVFRGDDKLPFIVVDKSSGGIKSIRWNGQNVLDGDGLNANFTRATTDNDRGGMELVLDFLRIKWASSLLAIINKKNFSYEKHWRDHGLSQSAPPSVSCTHCTVVLQGEDDESARIEAQCSVCASSGDAILHLTYVYTIFSIGKVKVEVSVKPHEVIRHIPSLPRIGLSLVLNPLFHRIQYFGRGPHENYSDRKSGAHFGTWKTSPSQMGFSYIVPSENGSRSDCNRASFETEDRGGLVVTADPGSETFSFSAHLHSTEELHEAIHTCDLEERQDGKHSVYVNVDHKLMGVGGDVRYVWALLGTQKLHGKSHSYCYFVFKLVPMCLSRLPCSCGRIQLQVKHFSSIMQSSCHCLSPLP